MDLKRIREELRRLSALAEGWSSAGELSALERDLALEKLRALYDAVRFAGVDGADAAAAAPADDSVPMAVPVDLGLDDLLSPVAAAPADDISNLTEERPVETEPAPVPAEPVPEPQAESVAVEPEPETVSEPTAEPEPLPALQAEATEPEPDPEPASEPQPEAVAAPESATAPQPVVGSLFGFEEEEMLRHRRKQRVIMSLYDAPEPAKTPAKEKTVVREAAPPAEKSVAEPPAAQTASAAAADAAGKPAAEPIPAPAPQPAPEPACESPEPAPIPENAPAEEPDPQQIVLTSGSVLGEVINHDVQTLSDMIEVPRDVASELKRREPVTDLERAIGINDKFLMIRDLFNGDAEAYDAAIKTLNGFTDLDDCMIHIAEHYAWNPNSDGAKLLMELLERKFA